MNLRTGAGPRQSEYTDHDFTLFKKKDTVRNPAQLFDVLRRNLRKDNVWSQKYMHLCGHRRVVFYLQNPRASVWDHMESSHFDQECQRWLKRVFKRISSCLGVATVAPIAEEDGGDAGSTPAAELAPSIPIADEDGGDAGSTPAAELAPSIPITKSKKKKKASKTPSGTELAPSKTKKSCKSSSLKATKKEMKREARKAARNAARKAARKAHKKAAKTPQEMADPPTEAPVTRPTTGGKCPKKALSNITAQTAPADIRRMVPDEQPFGWTTEEEDDVIPPATSPVIRKYSAFWTPN